MNTHSSYQLILIGLITRLLRNINGTDSAKFTLENLKVLGNILQSEGLVVSYSALTRINELQDAKTKMSTLKDDEGIGTQLSNVISQEMIGVEKIIFAESSTKKYT